MHNQCLNIDVQAEKCMTMNLLEERKRSMTVDIISRSISVGPGRDRTRDKYLHSGTLATALQYLSYIYSLYANKHSFCVVIRDLRIYHVHFIALLL